MNKEKLSLVFAWAIPFSLAGGGYFLPVEAGGITFYLFRWVVLVAAALGFFEMVRNSESLRPIIKKYAFVLFIWLVVGLLSYLYVIDRKEWMKDIFYLVIGISVFSALFYIHATQRQKAFLFGWITGYSCNLLFAFYEMYTGQHLSGEFTGNLSALSPEHYTHFSPAGFFGNPNQYGMYLVLSFLIFTSYRSDLPGSAFPLLLFPGIWQLFATGSKFSVFMLLILACFWILNRQKISDYKKREYLLMIPLGILFFTLFFLSLNFDKVEMKNESEKARIELQKTEPDVRPTSGNMRKAMLLNGIGFLRESKGIGLGAGQFSVYVKKGRGKHDAGTISDPHNGILEIAVNYGLAVIILLAAVYFVWIREIFQKQSVAEKYLAALWLLAILVLQNVNSGFISSPLSWFLMVLPIFGFHSLPVKK